MLRHELTRGSSAAFIIIKMRLKKLLLIFAKYLRTVFAFLNLYKMLLVLINRNAAEWLVKCFG
jgi:hypothetical protein